MHAGHALAQSRQSLAGVRPLGRAYASITQFWHLWRQRRMARRLAAQFTDRDLRDLGLTRSDIYREFAPLFWRRSTGP